MSTRGYIVVVCADIAGNETLESILPTSVHGVWRSEDSARKFANAVEGALDTGNNELQAVARVLPISPKTMKAAISDAQT